MREKERDLLKGYVSFIEDAIATLGQALEDDDLSVLVIEEEDEDEEEEEE